MGVTSLVQLRFSAELCWHFMDFAGRFDTIRLLQIVYKSVPLAQAQVAMNEKGDEDQSVRQMFYERLKHLFDRMRSAHGYNNCFFLEFPCFRVA